VLSKDKCPVGDEMRESIVVYFRVITEAAEIIRISIISVFYVELYVFSRRIMMKDWVA
jgi:hypothetical protein